MAADGTITPAVVNIQSGDSVRFVLPPGGAIVPTVGNSCTIQAYRHGDPDEFTLPMPVAPGGIFTLGPDPDGETGALVETTAPCPDGTEVGYKTDDNDPTTGPIFHAIEVGPDHLCRTGPLATSMPETWQDPAITGVFIRMAWVDIAPMAPTLAPGAIAPDYHYDFSKLDTEVDQAIANGKLYTLAFEAGLDGTPDWIFDHDVIVAGDNSQTLGAARVDSGGVPRLIFQDHSNLNGTSCGSWMSLGSPTNAQYQEHYFDMLQGVAAHLKERADRYRALAYVKLSGANMFTAENRLPNHCEKVLRPTGELKNCLCNNHTWAAAGYTPAGLLQYYAAQEATIASAFPGKSIIYPLIQDGFPRVDDLGQWLNQQNTIFDPDNMTVAEYNDMGVWKKRVNTFIVDAVAPPAPKADSTTAAVIDEAYTTWGDLVLPQHCGLQPQGRLPNYMVRNALASYTALQTQNIGDIYDLATLDSALRNADGIDNNAPLPPFSTTAYASTIEIYEELAWLARKLPGVLDAASATPRTLGEWSSHFATIRKQLGPPAMLTTPFTFTFTKNSPGLPFAKHLYYTVPDKCGAPGTIGRINIY